MESALTQVWDDILDAADVGQITMFVMLDLSAAFDMADLDLLLARLRDVAGMQGTEMTWCTAFLGQRMVPQTPG